jgi:hypothetical protein
MSLHNINKKGVWHKCDVCGEAMPECIAVPYKEDYMICDHCNSGYANHEIDKMLGIEVMPLIFTYCTYTEGRCTAPDDMDCHQCPNYRW